MPPSATHCPKFTALDFDGECAASDDTLSVVLDQLRQDFDPDDAEELVVWKDGQTIAAVMRSDGSLTVFEQSEPTPASKPPARPSNGKPRRR